MFTLRVEQCTGLQVFTMSIQAITRGNKKNFGPSPQFGRRDTEGQQWAGTV